MGKVNPLSGWFGTTAGARCQLLVHTTEAADVRRIRFAVTPKQTPAHKLSTPCVSRPPLFGRPLNAAPSNRPFGHIGVKDM